MENYLIVLIFFSVSLLVIIGWFFLREIILPKGKEKSTQTTTTFTSTVQSEWYSTNDEYGWACRRESSPGVWVSYREAPGAPPEVKAEASIVKKPRLKSRFELLKEKDYDRDPNKIKP